MITIQLVAMGAFAGFTIFLGLPIAAMKRVGAKAKGFLNAITIGVLLFILIEVLPEAKTLTEDALTKTGGTSGAEYVGALILGLALGIFSLVAYESRFIKIKQKKSLLNGKNSQPTENSLLAKGVGKEASVSEGQTGVKMSAATNTMTTPTFQLEEANQIALSIAIGIGVHNFSEGLAIGQSYNSLALSFTYLLILGFAIHNSTEGFGIAAPMAGFRPSAKYLAALGFVGGFPTLVGTIVGSLWTTNYVILTFVLALAAGALIYVVSGMFYVARRQTTNELFMLGLFVGFLIAFGTDLWLAMLGA